MNPSLSMIVNFLECSRRFQVDPVEACKKVETLKGLGFSDDLVSKILEGFPSVIARLKPLIRELKELGFSVHEIRSEVIRVPRILGTEIGEFSQCLRLLE
ncbi:hypothetical protein PIB30_002423, partial [Stylosanthes scabra]|nr:hypothetical protein [Stylosanthes scabra]